MDVNNPAYSSVNGVLFNKIQTVLVAFPPGAAGSYAVPNTVISIGNYAFESCTPLTSVTIPNSVTTIGDNAFYDCTGLTSLTLPSSVTTIGSYAFNGCSSLVNLTLSNGLTIIGNYAFNGCTSLTSLTLPSSVTSIGNYALSSASAWWGSFSRGMRPALAARMCSAVTTMQRSITFLELLAGAQPLGVVGLYCGTQSLRTLSYGRIGLGSPSPAPATW